MNSRIFVLFVCFLSGNGDSGKLLKRTVRAQPATEVILLYKNANFGGENFQLRVPYGNHCVDIPPQWDDTAISVDPGATTCVIVFVNKECQGKGVRLQKFTFGTMNLGDVGLAKQISSAQLC